MHYSLQTAECVLMTVNKRCRFHIIECIRRMSPLQSSLLLIHLSNLCTYRNALCVEEHDTNRVFTVSLHDLVYCSDNPQPPWWDGCFKVIPIGFHTLFVNPSACKTVHAPKLAVQSFQRIVKTHLYVVCINTVTYECIFVHNLEETTRTVSVDVILPQCICMCVSVNPCIWFSQLRRQNISCGAHATDIATIMLHRNYNCGRAVYNMYCRGGEITNIHWDADIIRHNHSIPGSLTSMKTHNSALHRFISLHRRQCKICVFVPQFHHITYVISGSDLYNFLPDDIVVTCLDINVFWKQILIKWPEFNQWKNTIGLFSSINK